MRFFKYLAINTSVVGLLLAIGYGGMVTQKFERFEPVLPKGSPAYVMQSCEDVPTGVLPTGVVLQRTGEGAVLRHNAKAIDRALDVALEGGEWPEMQVIAFCK